jgi:sugar lactone lactonase YvrE
MHRTLWAVASALLALTMLTAGAGEAQAYTKGQQFPQVISLPDGWQPEGIVAGKGATIYAGSLATGSIYAADARTGEGYVLADVTGRVAVGLAYDRRSGYIFAAGGGTGNAWVYDSATGATVGEFALGQGFINDVIITRDAAYFTNSAQAVFYRLPLGKDGALPAPSDVQTIPLGGEWEQVEGFNANGIEATQNGKYLIIVNSTVGKLYRVDPATGEARAIDLDGYSAQFGDGLLLKGRTLYVVRNRINTVAKIILRGNLLRGRLAAELTEPAALLDVPTTIAAVRGSLYVVNARFGTPPEATTTYTIVRLGAPEG